MYVNYIYVGTSIQRTIWKTSCLPTVQNERTYIRVTYRFLVGEIFGLRLGVAVFTCRYSFTGIPW